MSEENMNLVSKHNKIITAEYEKARDKEEDKQRATKTFDNYEVSRSDFGLFAIKTKKGSLPKSLSGKYSSVKQAEDSIKAYVSSKK